MSRPRLEVSPYPERRLKMFSYNFLNIGGGEFQENVDKRMQKTIVPIFAMRLPLSPKRHDPWTTHTVHEWIGHELQKYLDARARTGNSESYFLQRREREREFKSV